VNSDDRLQLKSIYMNKGENAWMPSGRLKSWVRISIHEANSFSNTLCIYGCYNHGRDTATHFNLFSTNIWQRTFLLIAQMVRRYIVAKSQWWSVYEFWGCVEWYWYLKGYWESDNWKNFGVLINWAAQTTIGLFDICRLKAILPEGITNFIQSRVTFNLLFFIYHLQPTASSINKFHYCAIFLY
jgi:hypothetical protein